MNGAMFIPLSQGKVATVSPEDFEMVVAAGPWHASWITDRWYARHTVGDGCIHMHRFILGNPPSEFEVDHRDNNGLNNQRDNLRIAKKWQNQGNRRVNKATTTGYRGVYERNGKFRAKIEFQGRSINLGTFRTAEEADLAYRKKALELRGEFAIGIVNAEEKAKETARIVRRSSTGFTGVWKKRSKFEAEIRVHGKKLRLGSFATPELAACAYDAKAIELLGVKAKLNFPLCK